MDFAGSVQTSLFAYALMAVIAMMAAIMVRGIVLLLQRTQQKKVAAARTAVSISVTPEVDEAAAHVAAVAAAVYAVLGAHRLVHIGEAPRGPGWTTIGRLAHHASHAPRRSGR